MINDPCNSALIPGFYGDSQGNLVRCKSTLTIEADNTATCGYVLYCPDYHTTGHTGDSNFLANLFVWTDTSSATRPDNTGDFPYGGYAHSNDVNFTTTSSHPDPFSNLISSDIIKDGRTIGACLKATYTGALINSGGQVCALENLPLTAVLGDYVNITAGNETTPLSVDELFQYSTKTARFTAETVEVKARPDDSSETFRTVHSATHACNEVTSGVPSSSTTLARSQQPIFIGIAWRGLPTGVATPIIIDLIKSVEWRSDPRSGITVVPPKTVHVTSMAKPALHVLDTMVPNWTTTGFEAAGKVTGQIAADTAGYILPKLGRFAADAALAYAFPPMAPAIMGGEALAMIQNFS